MLRLLQIHRSAKPRDNNGFTLVEMMIVVAIVGLISAVAIPHYLRAQSRSEAAARIGEALGLAKECSTAQSTKLAQQVQNPADPANPFTCNGAAASNHDFVVTWAGDAQGVRCLNTTIAGESTATINVSENGEISCSLS